jgi:hypothetical protein
MAKKKATDKFDLSLGGSSDIKSSDLRESFFADQKAPSSEDGRERFKHLINSVANSFLFKTKKSTAVVTAIITLVVTLGFTSLGNPNPNDTTTLAARISGGVALTEPQLHEVVKAIKQKVYWAGPMSGAKYTINAQNFNSIYVRYLPNGTGISDQTPRYRVIATYKEANAYNSTLSAGNQANGVSFTKNDGRVVYYNKQVPTNVYVAFKTEPYQMEIFDPEAKTSLAIANSKSDLSLID